MPFFRYSNISISGIAAAVPTERVSVDSFRVQYGDEAVDKFTSRRFVLLSLADVSPARSNAYFVFVRLNRLPAIFNPYVYPEQPRFTSNARQSLLNLSLS
jgi:hypothetical protein